MPAHQIRIAALLVAYVLGCVALIAIGAAGGPQATSMVPAALNLTDLDDQAVDLAVDGAAVLAESASPLGDGWATMGSQAADFGRELSREIGPMVVIDQALGTQFGVVIAELAVVEQIAATTRSDMSETVRVQALAFTDQVKTRVDSEMGRSGHGYGARRVEAVVGRFASCAGRTGRAGLGDRTWRRSAGVYAHRPERARFSPSTSSGHALASVD